MTMPCAQIWDLRDPQDSGDGLDVWKKWGRRAYADELDAIGLLPRG